MTRQFATCGRSLEKIPRDKYHMSNGIYFYKKSYNNKYEQNSSNTDSSASANNNVNKDDSQITAILKRPSVS